ncbi:probable methyltransferase-like protein 24 [Macrobrachium nipponense]|uniref:probable methyltransferase-like protein 24 n=1 Tax=Macrobrachium nipponense TaxID=159736 RepID=UPI0030C8C357
MTRSMPFKSGLGLVAVLGVTMFAVWRPPQINVLTSVTKEEEETRDPKQEGTQVTPCPIPAYVSPEAFLQYEKQEQYKCENLIYFGLGDGSKGVCLDPVFGLDDKNCNVLSFGISKDWTFDDYFGIFGCKVYSFDPTIGQEDHQHAPNIRFLNVGISNQTETVTVGGTSCQLDTYENILKRLGLLDTVIDYLKMDVETAEMKFFEDVFTNTPHLLANIRQIGMETHYGRPGLRELFWDYYHRLACHGFKVMNARQYDGRTEMVWGRP